MDREAIFSTGHGGGGAGRGGARPKIYGAAGQSGDGVKICGAGRGWGGEHTACTD